MMYDPNSDKSEMANTYEDHVRLDKMGYTHEKKGDEDMGDDEIEEQKKQIAAEKESGEIEDDDDL